MKLLSSILMLLVFSVCASAQTSSDQSAGPNVTVIHKKWSIEVRNPALEKDLNKEMSEREEAERQRKNAERNNDIAREKGMPSASSSVVIRPSEKGARGVSATYVYELKVRNTGEKSIRALTWEYAFFEPGTEVEVGRRRFESKVSIGPGKTKTVIMRSSLPPTGTIDASKADRKSPQYSEQIVFESVEYSDGSVWQSTSN